MSHTLVNPQGLVETADDFGVAGGLIAGDTLYISGMAPVDVDLQIVGQNLEEQTRFCFDAFGVVLEDAGFTWNDVVKINTFVAVDDPEALGTYCGLLKEYLTANSSRNAVAHTYVEVKALALPGVLIEIEGVAIRER